jgi:hypothetical protein
MNKLLVTALAVVVALISAGTAAAAAPSTTTSTLHLDFVDTDTCSFPIATKVDQTRTTTAFDRGDVKRHVTVTAVLTANGHTAIETDTFEVFIDHRDPTDWKITGRFTQIRLDGRLITLQSGLISFDPTTGELTDPHPGPAGTNSDDCTILTGS